MSYETVVSDPTRAYLDVLGHIGADASQPLLGQLYSDQQPANVPKEPPPNLIDYLRAEYEGEAWGCRDSSRCDLQGGLGRPG